ncbi:hypothetical protein C8R44DRAFT_728784 [Mycena epipterygia]|nr:hypothetical protein C8R44DRAFT_728784 [Mycena epipterygia]
MHGGNQNYSPSPHPHKPKHRRRRTMSIVSTADNESKIALLTGAAPLEPRITDSDLHIAVGAFTRTGCARTSLRCFTLTLPPVPYVDYMYHDPTTRPPMPGDSPPQSPACSFASIPSISRTESPFSENETSIPPGWGSRGKGKGRERIRAQTLPGPRIHPVLDSLERDSLVGTGWVAVLKNVVLARMQTGFCPSMCGDWSAEKVVSPNLASAFRKFFLVDPNCVHWTIVTD